MIQTNQERSRSNHNNSKTNSETHDEVSEYSLEEKENIPTLNYRHPYNSDINSSRRSQYNRDNAGDSDNKDKEISAYYQEADSDNTPEEEDGEYGEYDDENEYDEENLEEEEDDTSLSSANPSALKLLFGMMINPIQGWKKIRRLALTPENTAINCLYPIIALASASCFLECLYNNAVTVSMAMITAVKIFAVLFFGNFLALAIVRILMPENQKKIADSEFGKKYFMYLLSTLGIFWILFSALPMLEPIIAFTPLWTIYLATRGARFFRFPEERTHLLTTLMCIITIAAPAIIYWVADIFLPSTLS